MRRVLWLFLAAGAAAAAESPERTLTLEESIRTATQNSQALLAARDDVRIAQQRVVESRSLLYPTVGLNMNASRYLAEDPAVLPWDFGSTVLTPVDEPDNFFTGRLYLRQLLYNGGRTKTSVRLAETALAQARIREQEIMAGVSSDVIRAFYDVLLAEKRRALGEAAGKDLQALAAEVRGDAVGGAVLESLTARHRRDQAERRRNEERARLAYVGALGLELYTSVALSGELASDPLAVDLPKLLARAQETRLEIQGTEYQRETDQLAVYLSESERNPVVALGAGYELSNDSFPLDRAYWNATLNVNLPLFDGFASRARIRQSRLAANQNRIARAAVEDGINREVREAHAEMLFWEKEVAERKADADRLDDLQRRMGGSRAVAERAAVRLEALASAEAHWDSVHGHRLARARLETAVGTPLRP